MTLCDVRVLILMMHVMSTVNNGSDIVLCYYHNHTQIFQSGQPPLFSKRLTSQIELTNKRGLSVYEGLYAYNM